MAKFIQFPYHNERYKDIYSETCPEVLPIIPEGGVLYSEMPLGNEHHYTTAYAYEHVLPAIDRLLGFGFSTDDFDLVPCSTDKWDISYMVPKRDDRYDAVCFETGKSASGSYTDMFDPVFFGQKTYRELYRFPHTCSRLRNLTLKSGRRLMVSGDSQMVPCILPLSNYFDEVWYFDNRTGYFRDAKGKEPTFHRDRFRSFSKHYSSTEFTDVIVGLYCRSLDWYLYWNIQ